MRSLICVCNVCACVYESSEASAYSFGLATNPNPTRARSYPLNINPKPDPKPESISGPADSGRDSRPLVLGEHHIIVRMDNMAVVSHINRQGGSNSCTLDRLARHLLLWSQDKFLSLRAVHVPGVLNLENGRFSVETEAQARGMDVEPSDGIPDLGSVWQNGSGPLCFTRVIPVPALVLPKFPDDSGHRCIRPLMAECQSVCVSANKADSGSTMQSEGERCPSPSHSPILALPDLVLGANSPLVSAYLGDSDQAGLTVPASGQNLASSAGALEVVGMAHTGPRAVIDGLPAEVQETIASARAPATRKLYSSKWGVFESWCLTRAIDPVNCPVGPVLEFLQERLTTGAAATTLRVYVAAIAARRELDEIPLGRHRLVSAFMRGARRLRPVRPTAIPSWDLSVVLEGLVTAPFEPLESASDRILTLKVVLLLALTSLKRVGDLQAFSVSEICMDFAPGLVKVTLRPRPGYIPKVLSTSFRSQVVTLHSFHPPPFASSENERLHLLCPVRALKLYVDRSKVWRKSPQLLICFGAGRRGLATSKQRISHWVRDAISLAYEVRNLPSPLSLRAHSTRGVASSQALFRGVPLEDICVAAGWSSPHTFVRFYNLDVDTAPGSQVLSVWTDRMLLVHFWAR